MLPADVEAVAEFETFCAAADGGSALRDVSEWKAFLSPDDGPGGEGIIATAGNCLVAAGRISVSEEVYEVRAFLDGQVHPGWRQRGLGSQLLERLESRAAARLAAVSAGRREVLRIMFYHRGVDAVGLFEQHGYLFHYAEQEMVYPLIDEPPLSTLPPGVRLEPWSATNAHDFYLAYADAFRTRTKHLMDEQAWRHHFANPGDGDFRPQFSFLARAGAQPAGFVVCHVNPEEPLPRRNIWITQLGVGAGWRGHGIASALIRAPLRLARRAGFTRAMLSVNLDNIPAREAYIAMGFQDGRCLTMYRKELTPARLSE